MKALFGVILCIPLLLWGSIRIRCNVSFAINCGGHMELAGSANSIELARQEMEIVVKYAEDRGMTSGYTSILYNTPGEDVGFWYNNMKASLDELRQVKPTTTELEKSNLLIKLRESLLRSDRSTDIAVPHGISIFPLNIGLCLLCAIGCILALVGIILIACELND